LPSTVEQLHRELSPRGLSVVAVNIQESQATVAAWIREKKVTMPILLDTGGDVTREYGVIATPTSFLIDQQGRLIGRMVGPRDWTSSTARALLEGVLTLKTSRR
jgi:alkyl hydroperoxide reductase subunit AhpC